MSLKNNDIMQEEVAKEINKIISDVFKYYVNEKRFGNMSFSEFAIVENIFFKLQGALEKKNV